MGRKNGLLASVSAGRIIFTRTRPPYGPRSVAGSHRRQGLGVTAVMVAMTPVTASEPALVLGDAGCVEARPRFHLLDGDRQVVADGPARQAQRPRDLLHAGAVVAERQDLALA